MKILLTHSPEALRNYYGERALAGLLKLGDVQVNKGPQSLEGEALTSAAADCDLIVSYRQSPAPAAFVTAVTELVLGLLVDLSRGITRSTMEYRAGRVPQAQMGKELKGSTLGVIGHGAIGKEVSRVAKALGMRVLVHDPYQPVEQVPLDALLRESDYVVPLAVASAETENLMNAEAFAKMKPGAYLINVSRGNLVDEAALEAALDAGRLAGCAMDVGRAPDQMPSPRLAARADVIATPHTAGLTLPAIEHQSMETVAQAAEIIQGRAPKGAVNAEHWRRKP